MKYKIYPIRQGTYIIDKGKIEYFNTANFNKDYELSHGFFTLLDENDMLTLVDSGCPSYHEKKDNKFLYPISEDCISADTALANSGFNPKDVKRIILTNLHWEHSWNLDLFPNAQIFVQRSEMAHAVSCYKHEKEDYTITETTFGKGWTKGILRMRALEGDFFIDDGLKVITTPGHTPGSQSVLVDTPDGVYMLVGDWAYTENNWENQKAPGDTLDLIQWFKSYDKIMNHRPKIIPGHLNSVFETKVFG